MPFKMKVTVAGAEHEVDVDPATLPEGAISEISRVRKLTPSETFEAELKRRVDGVISNRGLRTADEFLDDQGHVAKILEKHGKQDAAKAAEQLAARLEAEKSSWAEKVLKPVATERDSIKTENTALVRRSLEREIIVAAADVGVKKAFRDSVGREPAAIVAVLMGRFKYDSTTGQHYVKDATGEGFAFSSDPKKYGGPHMGVAEFMLSWAQDKGNADYIDRQGQSGPRIDAGPGAPGAGEVVLTKEQAADGQQYQAALEKVKGDHSKIRIAGLSTF